MDPIERLVVWLGFEVDDKEAKRKVDGWLDALAGVVAVGAAAGAALVKLGVDAARAGDEVAKTARAYRLSAEELGQVEFAAQRAGVERLDEGLRSLVRNAEAFVRGAGEAKDAFAGLGISQADAKRMGTVELLDAIADGFQRVGDERPREAWLQRIFGESGGEFVNLLRDGADGVRALRHEAEVLGYVISNEDAAASEEFVDSLTDLQAIATGLARRIGFRVLPALQRWADWMRVLWDRNRMIVLGGIDRMADTAADAFDRLRGPLGAVVGFLTVWAGLRFARAGVSALEAIPGLGTALAGIAGVAPGLLAAAAGLLALYLAADDLAAFMAGDDSVLEDITDRLGITDDVRHKLEQVRDLLREVGDAAGVLGGDAWDWAGVAATKVGRLARALAAVVTSSREFQAAWAMSPLSGIDDAARWFTNWLANDRAIEGFSRLADSTGEERAGLLARLAAGSIGESGFDRTVWATRALPSVGMGNAGSGVLRDVTVNTPIYVTVPPGTSRADMDALARQLADLNAREVRVALEAP